MKIVYISSSIIPSRSANSIHVMKMCQAFTDNGNEIILLAPNKSKQYEPLVNDIWEYYGIRKSFTLIKLPWLYLLKGKAYLYGAIAGVKAKLQNPDLVYCRNIFGAYIASLFGLPVIYESHSPIDQTGGGQKYLFLRLLKRKNFKSLVVITSALEKYYKDNYPSYVNKVRVFPDGADPLSIDELETITLPKSSRARIGYVGHLYRGKGMEVIEKLSTLCPWADFHVVGGTDDDLCYWKARCQNKDNVTFHGYVPHAKVAKFIYGFDVMLLPNQFSVSVHGKSRQDIGKWTSPLKAFEYMAAKKPIIASDIPVLHEIFQDEYNALLCSPVDIQDWKEALFRLCNDKELANRLALVAYKDFIKNYAWKARAEKVLKLI